MKSHPNSSKIFCKETQTVFSSKYEATHWLINQREVKPSFNSVYSRLNAHLAGRLHSGQGKNSARGYARSIFGYTFAKFNEITTPNFLGSRHYPAKVGWYIIESYLERASNE